MMGCHWRRNIGYYSHIAKSQAREEEERHAQAILIGAHQGTKGCQEDHFERCTQGNVPLEIFRLDQCE